MKRSLVAVYCLTLLTAASPAYAHSDSLMNDPEDPVQDSVYRVRLAEVDGIRFITAGPVCNALGHGTPGYNVVEYVPTPGVDPTHCVF